MMNQDSTLRPHVFHGMGRDDVEYNWFTCEVIWSENRIIDEAFNIVQLETTFRYRSLTWYINYKVTAPTRKMRPLIDIK
jgi:hypothetical protein